MSNIGTLKRGDLIRVRFGSKGTQLAVVHSWTRAGNMQVLKYSGVQKRWKGPVRLDQADVLERADTRALIATAPVPSSFKNLGRNYERNPIKA